MLRRVRIGLTALVPVVAVVLVVSIALAGTGQGSRQPAALSSAPLAAGDAIDKKVPHIPLVDEHGHRTSLAAFRGRYVVMAPSLTLCHEVCPMTTAALMRVRQTVDRAGLASKVAVVEVTVDPWRDSPAGCAPISA